MAEIDKFASLLLEEAKRFYERAEESEGEEAKVAFLHASLMLGFCSLEAHVNAVAEEMSERNGLSFHEKGVLLEQELRLEVGEFIEKGLRIYPLEERLYFLHRKFGHSTFEKSKVLPQNLKDVIRRRNSLTHPKGATSITQSEVKAALEAIISTIDKLYKAIYNKNLPAAARGLHSKLTF